MTTAASQKSLGTRLSIGNFLAIATVFVLLMIGINISITDVINQQIISGLDEKNQQLIGMLDASDSDLRSRVQSVSKALHQDLSGDFQLTETTVEIQGRATPELTFNGTQVNLDTTHVDLFKKYTGAAATVMAKTGDDFVRITTSLKNEKNERAIGTLLDRANPAYKAAITGQSYTGLATIFGRQYMAQYDPIKDQQGKIIGLIFVGLDFSDHLVGLKNSIRALKIAKTGYFYVTDTKEGDSYGKLIIHPSIEGENLQTQKDINDQEFGKEMLAKKNGALNYPWANKKLGETEVRKKIIVFNHYPKWDWLIAGGVYEKEYTESVDDLIKIYSLIATVITVLITSIFYSLFKRMVTSPLKEAIKAAQLIAQGDLKANIKTKQNNEIGQLITAINNIGTELNDIVQIVRSGSESVATASSEIAQGNHDLSARTEQQASALEETAAAMEQLSAAVQHNAESAKEARQMASNASTIATQGGEVVNTVVETMSHINDSSNKILDIIGVIDTIAFQTNILALNAAVEAARAGEQGRGFAVVASEVRQLAGRSATAAKEIKKLISENVVTIEKGSNQVNAAGTTMNEIVTSIQKVSTLVTGISEASAEQSIGVAQVGETITQMDHATQQNAALVEQMAASATNLKTQAHDLVGVVKIFKI